MRRIAPKANQESVWDYPRPPRVEPARRRVRVECNGVVIADSVRAFRVLETSHPPSYYVPPEDVRGEFLERADGVSLCEFKGKAVYWTVRVGDRVVPQAAWSYPYPVPLFAELRDYLAFYPGRVDACLLDEERVTPQEGDFYGGWITSDIVGPFKGGRGTWGW